MEEYYSSVESVHAKGVKFEKTCKDYHEGKLDQEEFEQIQKENMESLSQEPFIQFIHSLDDDFHILLGNLMNKKFEKEGKPPIFFGPEVPVPQELFEAVCQAMSNSEKEREPSGHDNSNLVFNFSSAGFGLSTSFASQPGLRSIWGKFGETDSGSEGEY